MNETIRIINQRRSTKSFKADPVNDSQLQAIAEAGRRAPSARNQQARHFTVIQNKELLEALSLEAKNIAKNFEDEYLRKLGNSENFNIFHGAPAVIIVSGDEQASMIESDCAAANQNMLIAAESLGLGGCWINFVLFLFQGEKAEHYKKALGLPEGYKPYCSVAVGYKNVNAANVSERKGNTITYIK